MALDTGLIIIDTAAAYFDSEERSGARAGRNQYLLFTKCGRCPPPRRNFAGFLLQAWGKVQRAIGEWEEDNPLDWQPRALEWNIEESLRRLQTDWIDLIQLHSCSDKTLRRGDDRVLHRAPGRPKSPPSATAGDGWLRVMRSVRAV